jgi:hypothetical protein
MSTNGTPPEPPTPPTPAAQVTAQPTDTIAQPLAPGEVVTAEPQNPATVAPAIGANQNKEVDGQPGKEAASDTVSNNPPSLTAITDYVRTLIDPRSLHQNSLQFTAVICICDNTGKGFCLPEQRQIPAALVPRFYPLAATKISTIFQELEQSVQTMFGSIFEPPEDKSSVGKLLGNDIFGQQSEALDRYDRRESEIL